MSRTIHRDNERAIEPGLAPVVMVQGTMSSVGKSVITAGLCRLFHRRGFRVAPFKAQNMSLNAAVTVDGGEIARSTFVQAQAAGIEPTVQMNPVLLKPEPGLRSQVVVLGKVHANQPARDYVRGSLDLWPTVAASLDHLRRAYAVVVAEGAGSPAELNLRHRDIVNMRVARYANASVLLVGDVDRGGVFAQLLGTLDLLPPEERALVRGLVVNRFRGDRSLFADGVRILEERSGLPVFGVVPWVRDLNLPEEDSVALDARTPDAAARPGRNPVPRVVVVRLPYIANFDDFAPLERTPDLALAYASDPRDLQDADLIILPGSKATVADLDFLVERGFARAIARARSQGTPVLGICGGFQMLGREIRDPEGVESARQATSGLGLLPHSTTFAPEKRTRRVEARVVARGGLFAGARGETIAGYEIHLGQSPSPGESASLFEVLAPSSSTAAPDGAVSDDGLVVGTYLHGIFENEPIRRALIAWLRERRGEIGPRSSSFPTEFVDPFDRWADVLEQNLDLTALLDRCGVAGAGRRSE